MKRLTTRRVLSLLLSIALLFSQTGLTVLAAEDEPYTPGILCEHHTEHTPECGYTEGALCTHEHTPDCYTDEPICGLVEDADSAATDGDASHTHTQECYALNCAHEHDAACGYAAELPCNYKCDICGGTDSGDAPLGASSSTVTGFDALAEGVPQQTVPAGTALENLNLPDTLEATGYTVEKDTKIVDSGTPADAAPENGSLTIEGVTWKLDPTNAVNGGNSTYDPAQGSYCFTPVLPESYTLAEGVRLPEIFVMVGGANVLATGTGDFTVEGGTSGTDYTYADNTLTIKSGEAITISGTPTTDQIVVDGSCTGDNAANITLNGVSIDKSGSSGGCAFEVAGDATCNLTLKDGSTNTLKSGGNCAGLQVQSANDKTATLTIDGTGTLDVSGGTNAAGIGAAEKGAGGTITINGSGPVTATGNGNGAGIGGGGNDGVGGNITINGGTVTASGGSTNYSGGAGIGGGGNGSGGTIIINGGTVTARGGGGGAGIGGGFDQGGNPGGGTITINGGAILAIPGAMAAAIGGGSGHSSANTNVTISGGTVTAQGAIGGGSWWDGSGGQIGSFSTTAADGTVGHAFIVTGSISDKSDKEKGKWGGVIFVGDTGEVYGSPTLKTDAEIPEGKTLTVGEGKTLTIDSGVTLTNNGTIKNYGTINGDIGGSGTVQSSSSVTVELSASSAAYGDTTITITAKTSKTTTKATRSAAVNTVDFNLGNVCLGTENVTTDTSTGVGTATLTMTKEVWKNGGTSWTIGDNTITADFGGTSGTSGLIENTGTATLTVSKANPTTPTVPASGTVSLSDGKAAVALATVNGQAYQYTTTNTAPTAGTGDWKTATGTTTNFTGLTIGTTYYFWTYIPGNDYYEVSAVSGSLEVPAIVAPAITTHPQNKTVTSGATAEFSVAATGGQLKYQWQVKKSSDTDWGNVTDGTGGASATYTTPATTKAINGYQYKCVVSNGTGADKAATSNAATLTVTKATPTISTAPTAAAITYGQTLADSSLTGGSANVAGNFAWKTGTTQPTVSDSDKTEYDVTFTPSDTTNYDAATTKVKITVNPADGNLIISCSNVTYDTAVSPKVTTNTGGGTVTYSYQGRDGTSYDSSSTPPTDAGKYTVTGTAAATTNYKAATSEGVDFEIKKALGATITNVTGGYTGDGSTFTYTIKEISGAEYSKDNSTWQVSNSFTGFTTASVPTTFYARMKADTNHEPGASNNTGAVTFSKLPNPNTEEPALTYQVSGATGNKKITITSVSGCEYTFDDGKNWGSIYAQIFTTDSKPVIGIRYPATNTHNASDGAKQEVDLTNKEQTAPATFTLGFKDNGNGTFTATIPTVSGGEYSFDNTNWGSTNTKADCQPNTSYTGYVRLAAKDGYNASSATSNTQTSPSLNVVANPVIAPNGGSFSGSQSVTITTTTSGAKIHYTMDGSSPSGASTLYTGAFTLTGSATVQAIALKDGCESSGVIKAVFTKTDPAPTYTITANPEALDFGSLTEDYTQPAAQTVTIKNTGNQGVTVTLPTATNYNIIATGSGWSGSTAQCH